MAFYLGVDRAQDVAEAYRRYQEYLRKHKPEFPAAAFALATSEWYHDPSDHRCPHDAWLEDLIVSETNEGRSRATTIRVLLLGAYHDGYIEFLYPRVLAYSIDDASSGRGLGDWLYDEYRLSEQRTLIHEIEWSGSPGGKPVRWLIEATDVQYRWIPQVTSQPQ